MLLPEESTNAKSTIVNMNPLSRIVFFSVKASPTQSFFTGSEISIVVIIRSNVPMLRPRPVITVGTAVHFVNTLPNTRNASAIDEARKNTHAAQTNRNVRTCAIICSIGDFNDLFAEGFANMISMHWRMP